jgi:AbrB family looped-hinge helix DNA binding protein
MARITSKYQLTLPKAVAEQVGLKPGDEVDCELSGDQIRIRSTDRASAQPRSIVEQLTYFDMATERQRHREHTRTGSSATNRDWTRDELYES